MNIAICDDEAVFHKQLICMLNDYEQKKSIDLNIVSFGSGRDLLNSSNDFDIIFMDFRFDDNDDCDGIEISRKIREKNSDSVIIFISAYLDAAPKAYKVSAFRFLRKPLNRTELFEALDDYRKMLVPPKYILLNTHEKTIKINTENVIYAEAKCKNTIVRTDKQFIELHMNLKKFQDMLPEEMFIRCHKAYVVGFRHIEYYTNTEIIFDNNEKAQIGRAYCKQFRKSIKNYIKINNGL